MSSFHPQTPQSPSQKSPATTSSDAVHSFSNVSSMSTAQTLPTPAHSVNGASQPEPDVSMADESQKRKRALEDDGDRGVQKKLHLAGDDARRGIDDLHLDVGAKYLLCQNPHPVSLPRLTQDLYELYNLTGIAAELAREKVVEKVDDEGDKTATTADEKAPVDKNATSNKKLKNPLRKSYKGHLKRLGVAGSFEAAKRQDENLPSDFVMMCNTPDVDWHNLQVRDKEIGDGLSRGTLSTLSRLTDLAKGPVPRSIWDSSVLNDDAAKAKGKGGKSGKGSTPGTPLGASGTSNRPKLGVAAGNNRIVRTGVSTS
ncbi:uncharacterized protein F5Z01DRAFT_640562 [Emericellopsis atlantica]|uniref:Mediator of RNA polymerase II transcription subunit 19 n=1 Tax=Emericellopsis atlantica TaxID=2614577 RepID=A0A9P7ZE16_9HYPO|nr:uncharacterized protein F5Z01DRAFT_640562 [Emericellopsis atlantica]KAG9250072.1 hypothetical protein F5Z01DRAFT_640562 [Emericellopsis atlantica]